MKKNYLLLNLGLAGLLACSSVQASCGSNFCTPNHNRDEYSHARPGWSAGLSYSYSHADTLRAGSRKIHPDTSVDGEVENLGTYNRVTTVSADYTFNDHWGVMLSVPFINRFHNHTIGPYSGATPADYESFQTSALGDATLVGRYRWSLDPTGYTGMGIRFGLKLDTGNTDAAYKQTGEKPEEAALQAGNGSTDLILGLFWHTTRPGSDWHWFAQGTVQQSIRSSATFRPGRQINLDLGTRYAINQNLSGLLQLNAQWNAADSGEGAALTESLQDSSGGRSVFITPGLSYSLSRSTQLYGLLQLPLYQYVNGEQLTADSALSVGITHRF